MGVPYIMCQNFVWKHPFPSPETKNRSEIFCYIDEYCPG